jgi:hypothetical protein
MPTATQGLAQTGFLPLGLLGFGTFLLTYGKELIEVSTYALHTFRLKVDLLNHMGLTLYGLQHIFGAHKIWITSSI